MYGVCITQASLALWALVAGVYAEQVRGPDLLRRWSLTVKSLKLLIPLSLTIYLALAVAGVAVCG